MPVELDAEGAGKIFRMIDALEDSDDVQNVYANYDVSDEIMPRSADSGRQGLGPWRRPPGRPAAPWAP